MIACLHLEVREGTADKPIEIAIIRTCHKNGILNFLAILTGFLTYKVGVFAKQSKDVADEISAQGRQQRQRGSG